MRPQQLLRVSEEATFRALLERDLPSDSGLSSIGATARVSISEKEEWKVVGL